MRKINLLAKFPPLFSGIKKMLKPNLNLINIPCPFRKYFGIPCPTCGLTRSIKSLFELDIKKSLEYHPMTIFILPAVILIILTDKYKIDPRYKKIIDAYFCITALMTFITYVIRLKLNLIP